MLLARALDDADDSLAVPLGSMPWTAGQYGRQFLAALVPTYFETMTALHRQTGVAYSTIHDWSKGRADPRWESIALVVAVLEERGIVVDPLELLAGRAGSSLRVEYDDPYPERARALAPFRDSPDPAHQRAIGLLTAAGFKGTTTWGRERWTKLFLHYADEAREDMNDPERRARLDQESDETLRRDHLDRPPLTERIAKQQKKGRGT